MSKQHFLFLPVFLTLFSLSAIAQEEDGLGTEVVNIVKPYTPTISDAFKVKQTPVLNDSVTTQKKEVTYEIFSVPVASTFTPAKGKAETVERAKPEKVFDNYATLGFGNYTSILGELYSNFEISRTDNAGFYLRHNSAQGDVDDVRLETKYYDTQLDAHYTSRQRYVSYNLEAGANHQLFNWYGLPEQLDGAPDDFVFGIDPQQSYYGGYLGGTISTEDSFFEKVSATVRYTGDAFSSSELSARIQPEFQFNATDFALTLEADVDYLSGSFDKGYAMSRGIDYSWLNLGILPSLVYINEDLSLSLGVAAYAGLDLENSETELFLYPKINASYRLVDEFIMLYAGADGGLDQNRYFDFKEENPFVSPTLWVAPTSRLYEGFGGIKGKITNSVGYNLRASYGKDEGRALFQSNPYVGMSTDFEPFEYENSFGVTYDDINTLSLFGELKVALSEGFTLGVKGEYFSYETDSQQEAWNLPELTASLFSNFDITEQLYGGASLFYVGERKDLLQDFTPFSGPITQIVTLEGYLDANVHLGYKVNERLNFFLKGSNLLGDSYEKWVNYPVLGIQGLLGATYKFDW
ncbi:MAG: TonB-dependent receptor [Flavobacteriaceae bacterium]|nr:TonB-dependent receptor [Flavobacteriaceae bacterium]